MKKDLRTTEVERLLANVPPWAHARGDIEAVALVGSWARRMPRDDSDVDLVILTRDPSHYLTNQDWASDLGITGFIKTATWGSLTERRGVTASGLEVEFGITSPAWARVDPVDSGTHRVASKGMKVIYDRRGLLAKLGQQANTPDFPSLDLTRLDPYPEVHRAVEGLVTEISQSLGASIFGIYFDGSIALGDFDPLRSDIDLVVVIRDSLTDSAVAKLASVHAAFARSVPAWGEEIETIYVFTGDLAERSAQDGSAHCYVERETGGVLRTRPLGTGWLVHLRVLSRNGITIFGPDIRELVAPVADKALRRVAVIAADDRLRLYRDNPALLERPGARAFAVLTACRILYTFRTGSVVPKMEAARASLQLVEPQLAGVIRAAMSWRKNDSQFDPNRENVVEVLEFVRAECAREWR